MLIIPYRPKYELNFNRFCCNQTVSLWPFRFSVFLFLIYLLPIHRYMIFQITKNDHVTNAIREVLRGSLATHQMGSHLLVDNSSIGVYINTFILRFEEWCFMMWWFEKISNQNWNSISHMRWMIEREKVNAIKCAFRFLFHHLLRVLCL